jgi:hypothetical protein
MIAYRDKKVVVSLCVFRAAVIKEIIVTISDSRNSGSGLPLI